MAVQDALRQLIMNTFVRLFNELAKSIPSEVVDHIRGFPYLETTEEIEEFMKWCEQSEYPKIRSTFLFVILAHPQSDYFRCLSLFRLDQ